MDLTDSQRNAMRDNSMFMFQRQTLKKKKRERENEMQHFIRRLPYSDVA
jgi:hypothetical protein